MFESLNSVIQVIVDRIVQTALQTYIVNLSSSQRDERDERDEREESEKSKADDQNDTDNVDNSNRWNVVDLDFYDSLYDEKFVTFETFSVEHFDKNSYFRDVHIFIDKVIELIVIKKVKMIKKNLWLNLRDTALKWWNIELFVNEKRMTRMSKKSHDEIDIDEWIILLHDRFKKSIIIIMNSLLHEKYTIRDAINRREFREYVQKILRFAKDAELVLSKNQFDIMFNDIDQKIRSSNIRRSKNIISFNDFLADMNEFKHDWWIKKVKNRSHVSDKQLQSARNDQKLQQFDQYNFNRQEADFNYYNSDNQRSNRDFQFNSF